MREEIVRIIRNEPRGGPFYRMDVEAPWIAENAQPGQFVHIQCSSSFDPLLRRPFSVYDADPKSKEVSILYAVVGKGTDLLSRMKPGDTLNMLAPLGHGFTVPEGKSHSLLLGGGAGIAPMLFLGKVLRENGHTVTVMLGMQSNETAGVIDDFIRAGLHVDVATNDGSLGACGHVTCLLEGQPDDAFTDCRVYACGPTPMLKAVQTWTSSCGLPAELSLEERMGCGFGVCLSCVCKVKVRSESGWEYQRACVEGPVFSAAEVILDE